MIKDRIIKTLASQARDLKSKRFVEWIVKVLRKRGHIVDPEICAYGKNHIVGEVIEVAGDKRAFKSLACSGCKPGSRQILEYHNNPKKKPAGLACALLENVLIHSKPVKEGEIVNISPINL